MSEMLLLGAGASVEAGIPGAYKMTERIAEIFRDSPQHKVDSKVVAFVVGGLLFKRGIEGQDALTAGVNVEELFNAVQLLADRGRLEASPFVGSWHAMVEELDQIDPPEPSLHRIQRAIQKGVADQVKSAIPNYVSSHYANDIDKNLQSSIQKTVEAMVKGRSAHIGSFDSLSRAVGKYLEEYIKKWTENLRNTSSSNFDLEQELKKLADQQPRPGQGRVFEFVAEHMIYTLVDIVWMKDAARVEHLRPILALVEKQKRLTVATLNYDNSVELAASSAGIACETGIANWSKTGKFSFPTEGVSLLKLHGSIEWEQGWLGGPEMIDHLAVRPVNFSDMRQRGYRPAVIFGHRNKLTAEGPFLDILQAFVRALDDTELLTIVGYSFGDTHINALVTRWMNGKPTRRVRIVNRSFDKIKSKFTDGLERFDKSRIEILQENAGSAFRKLYGDFSPKQASAATSLVASDSVSAA